MSCLYNIWVTSYTADQYLVMTGYSQPSISAGLPGWVALRSEVQTRAADGRRLSEDGCLTWYCWVLRRFEMKQGRWPKHSTQTRHRLPLSPWDACPYIKMWFGALTGTHWGEARWEGLGLQCKPQTHSLPPALPSCIQLYYIHSCWCASVRFVYVLCVSKEGTHKIALSL